MLVLVLRNNDDAAVVELAQQLRGIAELYGAETSKSRRVDAARSALEVLSSGAVAEVTEGTRSIRQSFQTGTASVE